MTTVPNGTKSAPFIKDPEATLDYIWNWTDWLVSGDQIEASSPAPVVTPVPADDASVLTLIGSPSVIDTGRRVTAYLSGGTAGKTYSVNCLIHTTDSRIDARVMYIKCKDR